MRKFKQDKLWRDKLVDIIEQKCGSKIHWRRLDGTEFDKELRIKLLEEVQEVTCAKDKTELVNELANVYEVIDTLANVNNISKEEIFVMQREKRKERGGFVERKFVEVAEHPIGSFGEKYCLADPKKYPEI
ncbi:MAG: nucleotide pyrophosphohydrolase [Epsilonproteobacteria bacterium]|nr:nucleotide pyrophosphohydrolase [Campylobacterota bacterium]|tara:strand:+ start:2690 stop:3082 length:393 start_codon:yes stop_codon:yes gene_type:complete